MEEKNFALLVKQQQNPDGSVQMMVRSENQGINDTEIVLIVEAWLEKVKERVKKKLMGSMQFDEDENS